MKYFMQKEKKSNYGSKSTQTVVPCAHDLGIADGAIWVDYEDDGLTLHVFPADGAYVFPNMPASTI